MSGIRLKAINKNFGDFRALRDIDLEVREGEFVTLLGASGSGKTTCLRTIAGFVQPDSGHVFIANEDVTKVPVYRRNIGVVFQHYALFPHMTIAENVAYGLVIRRLPKVEIKERTLEALKLVHLDEFAGRYPRQLSGGQKQRVALARAVVIKPRVLLMDEPLGALDLKLREELQVEIRRVQQTLKITTISVTHDQNEALSMSDRVVVMEAGQILQIDTPTALYRRPTSIFVAKFVGRTNSLLATVKSIENHSCVLALDGPAGGQLRAVGAQVEPFKKGDRCIAAFRPEDVQIGVQSPNKISVQIDKVTYFGNGWLLTCAHVSGAQIFAELPASATPPEQGATISLGLSVEQCLLYTSDGGRSSRAPVS